ncbi:hypothetical protein Z951_11275 [Streptomyces sp. PRh5]|nr:hypothetical protein Z951_11275 [Streptomyces sp. PRh5]
MSSKGTHVTHEPTTPRAPMTTKRSVREPAKVNALRAQFGPSVQQPVQNGGLLHGGERMQGFAGRAASGGRGVPGQAPFDGVQGECDGMSAQAS